jgi:phage baseplate assembly protein W
MGSLVVKLDKPVQNRILNQHHYSDIDMLNMNGSQNLPEKFNFHVNDVGDQLPMAYDVEAVKISIRNILTWRVGESVLRPEFGHNLKLSMYSQMIDVNKEAVCQEIKRAIEVNEPRVDVISVDARKLDDDENMNSLQVRVAYNVKGNRVSDLNVVDETIVQGR